MGVCAHIVGETPVPLWGLSSHEWYRRMLKHAGMTVMVEDVSSVAPGDSVLIIRGDYLFDGRVLHSLANSLNVMLEASAGPTRQIVAAHVPANLARQTSTILSGGKLSDTLPGVRIEKIEDRSASFNENLRKSQPLLWNPSDRTRNERWKSVYLAVPTKASRIWSRNGCGPFLRNGPRVCAWPVE